MSTRKTVKLFYDVVSPYSWFAFETLTRYQSRWAMELKLKPFFLGGVMAGTGNRPPAMVPAKGQYMFLHDLPSLTKHYGLPLRPPANPDKAIFGSVASLAAMRFLTALSMRSPNHVEEVSRQLWLRIWSQDKGITEKDHLKEAGLAAGLDAATVQQCLEAMSSSEVKDTLKNTTQEAIDSGAFGAPWIITEDADKETRVLFGCDRMHILADILGERYEGPLNELNKAKL